MLLFVPTKIILPPCAQGPLYLAGEACAVYDTFSNTCLQNYKFPLTLAQDLAEICYKKLQIGNFSAADVGKWWKFSNSTLLYLTGRSSWRSFLETIHRNSN